MAGVGSMMADRLNRALAVWVTVLALPSCTAGDRPDGLAPARKTGGPTVVFELTARPFPKIPFPNNVATRIDSTSPTGRRVTASLTGATALERDARAKVDRLTGFSTIGAISVYFDAPLDLNNLIERHQKDHVLSNDAVFIFNLDDPDEEPVEIDMGRGNFPVGLERTRYFDNDPRAESCTIMFETVDEDLNGNGVLDLGEDTNDDDRLGRANFRSDPTGNCYDDLITFYDRSENILVLKPVVPLREETNYAVVLTDQLVGEDGLAVQSPFPFVNHVSQTEDLKDLPTVLSRYGISKNNIAFTWTFTTQSVSRDLVEIRKGLYGKGPFAFLIDFTPAELKDIPPIYCDQDWKDRTGNALCNVSTALADSGGNVRLLKASALLDILTQVLGGLEDSGGLGLGILSEQLDALKQSYEYVDYVVQGVFETPYFICHQWDEELGKCVGDELGVFDIDPMTGRVGNLGKDTVVFWLAVPKPNGPYQPPFPVTFYGHGYTSSRVEFLGFAGHMARYGIASIGMEAVGHGTPTDDTFMKIANAVAGGLGLSPLLDVLPARGRDLNGDGIIDSGGDFFSVDTFHTRDVVRQSIIDYMQLVRILRTFDGTQTWDFDTDLNGALGADLAGDFNGDGVVDVGGPENGYYAWGQSLGGILSSVLVGIEPYVKAAAPVSGGGGLIDIGARTTQGGVVEAVFLPLMGPMIISGAPAGDEVPLLFLIHDVNDDAKVEFARTAALTPGDWVRVENLANKEQDVVRVHKANLFRAHIASDKGDPLRVTIYDGAGCPDALEADVLSGACPVREVIDAFENDASFQSYDEKGKKTVNHPAGSTLVSLAQGYGYRRNHPDMRRFTEIAQMILDPADPANYAPRYFLNPLVQDPSPAGSPGKNVLVVGTIGDMNVPINTALMIARAAGILESRNPDPRYGKSANDLLIDNFVFENLESLKRFNEVGLLFDPDDLSSGTDDLCVGDICPPRLSPPLRATVDTSHLGVPGKSALRLPLTCPNDHLDDQTGGNPCGFGADQHGFFVSSPQKGFDIDTFMANQIGWFFRTQRDTSGAKILDDPCLEDSSCPFILPPP